MTVLLFLAGLLIGALGGLYFGFREGMLAEAEEAARDYRPPMSADELARAFVEGL